MKVHLEVLLGTWDQNLVHTTLWLGDLKDSEVLITFPWKRWRASSPLSFLSSPYIVAISSFSCFVLVGFPSSFLEFHIYVLLKICENQVYFASFIDPNL